MSGVTRTTNAQPWEQCLTDLNERDGAVEITGLSAHRKSAIDANKSDDQSHHVAPSFRVRVLAWRPAGIVVDQPTNPEEAHYFQQGAVVRVLVVDGAARWELITTVTSRIRFQLNENSVVAAIVLSRPHEVNSVQRREFFRVSTAAAKIPPVQLTPVVKIKTDQASTSQTPQATQEPQQPFGPEPLLVPFTGILVNVGGGGMGVEASDDVAFTLSLCRRFKCVVNLPSMDEALVVDCTMVHLETQAQGMHYLGLRFEVASAAARRRVEDQICHFTSWLQRQQLQRMKRER